MKFIPMKCPSCGAGLEITSDMDFFACGYCGQSEQVIRKGGTVSLQIAAALDKVQANTDRTASELALKRLGDELISTQAQRAELYSLRNQIRYACTVMDWIKKEDFIILLVGTVCFFAFLEKATIISVFFIMGTLAILLIRLSGRVNKVSEAKSFNACIAEGLKANIESCQELDRIEAEIKLQIVEHRKTVGAVSLDIQNRESEPPQSNASAKVYVPPSAADKYLRRPSYRY